jgi:hypothetical protein
MVNNSTPLFTEPTLKAMLINDYCPRNQNARSFSQDVWKIGYLTVTIMIEIRYIFPLPDLAVEGPAMHSAWYSLHVHATRQNMILPDLPDQLDIFTCGALLGPRTPPNLPTSIKEKIGQT